MLTYDEAHGLVLERLSREIEPAEDRPPVEPAIVDDETIERPWGWVFFWNTRLFAETRDMEHALVGTDPICVNRADGSIASLANVEPIEPEIRRYERRIGVRPWWRFW